MRRTDREVTDRQDLIAWLREAAVGRIAFAVGSEAYVVPLNFGILSTEPLTLVFHCAAEGRKLEMMRSNPRVCFEADLPGDLVEAGDEACRWGMKFRSVLGWGRLERVEDEVEKRAALVALMEEYAAGRAWRFDEAQVRAVVVLKLTLEKITGKRKG
jgi:hypothetical protein